MARVAPLSLSTVRDGFRHEALLYEDEGQFLGATSSFLREGLEQDEPALVVVGHAKLDALRSELGDDAARIFFADMAEVGSNPARIIPAWREFVDRFSGHGLRVRGIGEPIWAGRSPAELVECQRHESLLNLAFADTPGFYLLCPYDTSTLDEAILEEARCSHPHLTEEGKQGVSPRFRELAVVAEPFSDPLPEPPARRYWRAFQSKSLDTLRAWIAGHAARAGLSAQAGEELVLAAHEIATNSVVHGGGGGMCRIWIEDDALVCEVNDRGGVTPPLAGREAPSGLARSAYGLWLANQLCDLVQLRAFVGGGTVRLHKRRT
jgi:anti-sigma regulatory factor (Ser/Thr protein kinase)